ncbi:MAG: hypothetical protein II920_08915 [Clostridia bacterium]|nr:hypothetical protein [Clostridia bacterium]
MKVVRVIKVIVLVAAIISLLVTCAGNFFILKDACDNSISAEEVHAALDAYEFKLGSIFSKASAEGDENGNEPAGEPEAQNDETEQTGDTAGDEFVSPAFAAQDAKDNAYQAGKHLGIINGLMKAGNARIKLSFLNDISFNLGEKFGKIGMRGDEEGKPVFEVNLWLCISVLCFTVAFILHVISKKRRKTVWSVLMMLFGYILFLAFYGLGQILANIDINALSKVAIEDFTAYRIYVVTGCTFLGFLLGLGYYRCGSRATKKIKKKLMKRVER